MVVGSWSRWSVFVVLAAVGPSGCSDDDRIRIGCPVQAPSGGDESSTIAGVSFDGSVVAGSCGALGGYPYRWEAGLSTQVIAPKTASGVTRISRDGSTVLGQEYTAAGRTPFRWTAKSGLVPLAPLPSDLFVGAWDVSADGSVVVGVSTVDERLWVNNKAHPFRWTEQTGMEAIGPLPEFTGGAAIAVSADGHVVVGHYSSIGPDTTVSVVDGSFFWSDSGEIVVVPRFVARAVNRDGSVAVGSVDLGLRAAKWTPASGVTELPPLPGHYLSQAFYVSADGETAVGTSDGDGISRPVRWSADGTPVDIGGGAGFPYQSIFMCVSDDAGVAVASGDVTIVWDVQSGARAFPGAAFNCVSPDGRFVYSGFYDGRDAFLMPRP